MSTFPELASPYAVETAAVAWVMALESEAGRRPRDMRHVADASTDIESPPRLIEVKAFGRSARGASLPLEGPQLEAARTHPDSFYLYVVENVRQGDPSRFTLRVLHGEPLAALISRAKERRYYEVPWPVAHYLDMPEGLV